MTIKLHHVEKFFNIVQTFESDSSSRLKLLDIKNILKDSKLVYGQLIEPDDVLDFCMLSNLITVLDGEIQLLDDFKTVQNFFHNGDFDSVKSLLQKNYLKNEKINPIFLSGVQFFINNKTGLFIEIEKVVSSFLNSKIIDVFWMLDILLEKNNLVFLNPEIQLDRNFIKKMKKPAQTQAQLDDLQKTWKEIGEIAEEIILKYEYDRLSKLGCVDELEKICQVSISNTRLGYDILSFNDKTGSLIPDRFIEVKGTTEKNMHFHWSCNEIDVAEKESANYYLYFVSEIDRKTRTSPNLPEIIPNPYKNIFQNPSEYDKDNEGYYIEKK